MDKKILFVNGYNLILTDHSANLIRSDVEFPYINSLVVRMTGMNYIAEYLPCEVF